MTHAPYECGCTIRWDGPQMDGNVFIHFCPLHNAAPGTAAERDQLWAVNAALVAALRRVLDWPLPDGSVKTYALPKWLWQIAESALAKAPPAPTIKEEGNDSNRTEHTRQSESEPGSVRNRPHTHR